jgi:hypothetical protein
MPTRLRVDDRPLASYAPELPLGPLSSGIILTL